MGNEKTGYCAELQRRYGRPGDKHPVRSAPGWSCDHSEADSRQASKQAPDGAICDKCRRREEDEKRREKERQRREDTHNERKRMWGI